MFWQIIQYSSCLCLSMGRQSSCSKVPTTIQLLLAHGWHVHWGILINIWWHQDGYHSRQKPHSLCSGSRNYQNIVIRIHVFILRENSLSTALLVNGIHLCPWTLPTESPFSPSFPAQYSGLMRPIYIPSCTRCLEKSMKIYVPIFSTTEVVNKVGVQ